MIVSTNNVADCVFPKNGEDLFPARRTWLGSLRRKKLALFGMETAAHQGLPFEDQPGQDVEPMSPPSLQSSAVVTIRKRGSGIG